MNQHDRLYRLLLAALYIAMGLVLPLFLGQVKVLMQGISPMHIPAFLAGLTLGPAYGCAVGLILPLLRMAVFGIPIAVNAIPMAPELAVYGLLTGCLYPLFAKKLFKSHLPAILLSMAVAMVAGRFAGGAAKAVLFGLSGSAFTFQAFVTAYFLSTAVGAGIHLLLCPAVTLALEQAKLSPVGNTAFALENGKDAA